MSEQAIGARPLQLGDRVLAMVEVVAITEVGDRIMVAVPGDYSDAGYWLSPEDVMPSETITNPTRAVFDRAWADGWVVAILPAGGEVGARLTRKLYTQQRTTVETVTGFGDTPYAAITAALGEATG